MSVTLRKRKNGDGTTTLRLDIYHNGQRTFETLKNLKLDKPTTPLKREENKQLMRQAEAIRVARAAELEANNYDLVSDLGKKTEVIAWLKSYLSTYQKKDYRNMDGVISRFETYLKSHGKGRITFIALNAGILEGFIDQLNDTCHGEGASSYYSRLKKALRQAYKKRLMKENIIDFVEKKPKGKAEKKDILTMDEIAALSKTEIQNPEIRRAVLFSAMTGVRWVDAKALTWSSVKLDRRILKLTQSKTSNEVAIPLNDAAIKILGEPGEPKSLVFDLPTANGANKTLKAWVKRAGINKKITFHNLRHSFGTNLIYNDVDILTASKLLGHTSLRHTQRYVNAAEEMKNKATDKLNFDL